MVIEKNHPSEKRSKEGGRRKRKHSESRERKGCQEFAGGEIRNEEVQETPLFGIFEKKKRVFEKLFHRKNCPKNGGKKNGTNVGSRKGKDVRSLREGGSEMRENEGECSRGKNHGWSKPGSQSIFLQRVVATQVDLLGG